MRLRQLRVALRKSWRSALPSRRFPGVPGICRRTPESIGLSPRGSVGVGRLSRIPHGYGGRCLSCGTVGVAPERPGSSSPSPECGLLAGPLRASPFFNKINARSLRCQVRRVLSRLPVGVLGAFPSAAGRCPSCHAGGRCLFNSSCRCPARPRRLPAFVTPPRPGLFHPSPMADQRLFHPKCPTPWLPRLGRRQAPTSVHDPSWTLRTAAPALAASEGSPFPRARMS